MLLQNSFIKCSRDGLRNQQLNIDNRIIHETIVSLPSDWNIPGTIGSSYGFGQPKFILCGPATYRDDNKGFIGLNDGAV